MRSVSWLLCGTIALAACERTSTPIEDDWAPAPPHMMTMPSGEDDICPMYVLNATVGHEDVEGGAAMTFTAPDIVRDDLRHRVYGMAEHYRAHPMSTALHMATLPDSRIVVEEHREGARIVFIAVRPESVQALRTHVRFHAERLERGDCPMGVDSPGGGAP